MAKSAARTYKQYPDGYFEVLEKLQKGAKEVVLRMNARDAASRRRDMYRFFRAIDQANIEEGEVDSYVRGLANISREITVSVVPWKSRPEEEVSLVLKINPVSRVMGEREE